MLNLCYHAVLLSCRSPDLQCCHCSLQLSCVFPNFLSSFKNYLLIKSQSNIEDLTLENQTHTERKIKLSGTWTKPSLDIHLYYVSLPDFIDLHWVEDKNTWLCHFPESNHMAFWYSFITMIGWKGLPDRRLFWRPAVTVWGRWLINSRVLCALSLRSLFPTRWSRLFP